MNCSRSVIVIIALLTTLSAVLGTSVKAQGDGRYIMSDFMALTLLYNEENGTFAGLVPGDRVVFVDVISISKLNDDGDTVVYLESTGGSLNSETIVFPGDITGMVKRGSKVEFTVEVLPPGNATGGLPIDCSIEDLDIIREERLLVDRDNIEIFGIKIHQDGLPEWMQNQWGRFGVVLGAWSLGMIVFGILFFIAFKIAKRTKTEWDERALAILKPPFFILLMLYGLLISLSQLDLSNGALNAIDVLFKIGAIILISYMVIKLFKTVILVYLRKVAAKTETKADDILVPVFEKLGSAVVWVAAIIMTLTTLGIDITLFVAGAGIAGLVIAFAAQDTLSNFFSGIMIMLDRPFKEDDWIQLDQKIYQVKDIGFRSTRLFHSYSNQIVTIPNNKISEHLFSNLSELGTLGRTTVKVGVGYGSDPARVGSILLDIARAHPETYEDESHRTIHRFDDFGDSALIFSLTFWVKDYNEQWRIASEVRELIFERFVKEGIEIPFPQRVLHIKGSVGAHGPVNGEYSADLSSVPSLS